MHSAEVEALATVVEKIQLQQTKTNLLRCKNNASVGTFNIRTLNIINQLPELTVSAAEQNIDIICVQEY